MRTCASWLVGASMVGLAAAHSPHDTVNTFSLAGDGTTMFLRSRYLCLKSSDGGMSWDIARVENPSFENSNLVASWNYATDETVYMVDNNVLFESTNGGARWTKVRRICVNSAGTQRTQQGEFLVSSKNAAITVDSSFNVRRSTGGNFFIVGDIGVTLNACPHLATNGDSVYLGTDDGHILESIDHGVTWAPVLFVPGGVRRIIAFDLDFFVITNDDDLLHVICDGLYQCNATTVHVPTPDNDAINDLTRPTPLSAVTSHTWQGVTTLWVLRSNTVSMWLTRNLDDPSPTWQERGMLATGEFFSSGGLVPSIEGEKFGQDTFSVIHAVQNSSRVFLAAYTGLWRSEDDGHSWEHMDTIGKVITGLTISSGATDDEINLGFCTYTNGCFKGNYSVSGSTVSMDALPNVWGSNDVVQKYSMLALSPFYAQDHLAFRFLQNVGSPIYNQRSQDDFATIDEMSIPGFNSLPANVQDVKFGDNQTVYVCGFNMGVAMSTDAGYTFSTIWTGDNGANWAVLDLVLSPTFDVDETIAILVDTTPDDADFDQPDSLIYVSKNRGARWRRLTQTSTNWIGINMAAAAPDPIVVAVTASGLVEEHAANIDVGSWYSFKRLRQTAHINARPRGYCHNGLAVSADGSRVSLAFKEGGSKFGTIADQTLQNSFLSKPALNLAPSNIHYDNMLNFHCSETRRADFRKFGKLIAFSPNFAVDNIVFAASFYTIMVSVDGGLTWNDMYALPHGTGYV